MFAANQVYWYTSLSKAKEKRMRAWQIPELGNPWEKLTIVQTDLPALQKGSVRISVEATDLNFADILQCQGT